MSRPQQYLDKEAHFYGRSFFVDENVLIPRMDTETLVEFIIRRGGNLPPEKPALRVLDLCTGSGCIGITLKLENPSLSVDLADVSSGALSVAQKNAKLLGADVRVMQSDMFMNITDRYDIIVSNPPYIKTHEIGIYDESILHEPHMALDGGADGMKFYHILAKHAHEHLAKGGTLAIEICNFARDELVQLFTAEGWQDIRIIKDMSGLERVMVLTWNG